MLATTAVHVLGNLVAPVDVDLDALVRGELGTLFASQAYWQAFPNWTVDGNLVAFGPAAQLAMLAAFVVAASRRWPRVPPAAWAGLLLLGGALPYAVGAIALHGNTAPADCGRWLSWMLVGPCYAAFAALGFLAVAPIRALAQQKLGHAAAAVS
ncbi:MAG: hypothetical protein JNL08_10685 [Planctomycetes bacterium]|nr:hypothetical protein [Planctomycetota bacterium]